MKKIVLAFDSFKGSARSVELAASVRDAILSVFPGCDILQFVVADGGEGTIEAICSRQRSTRIACKVHDALMNPIEAGYAILQDGQTAVIDMASAAGLPLIPPEKRNPMDATTFGVGELVADALSRGCRHIIMGIGGSATNDAGIGMLAALGVRFLDKNKSELSPTGANLKHIACIDERGVNPDLKNVSFTVACDVDNPFCGPSGAAFIYAEQKGASPHQIAELDEGMQHYAGIVKEQKGVDIINLRGAGAAGGMGGGLFPFLSLTLKPGIEVVLEAIDFKDALSDADLVITGEGRLDRQTTMGKAINGIVRMSQAAGVPVVGLGGSVQNVDQLNEMGLTAVLSIQSGPVSMEEAMQNQYTLNHVAQTVRQLMRLLKQMIKC